MKLDGNKQTTIAGIKYIIDKINMYSEISIPVSLIYDEKRDLYKIAYTDDGHIILSNKDLSVITYALMGIEGYVFEKYILEAQNCNKGDKS